MLVQEIARLVGGEFVGDGEREITNIAKIEDAGEGNISFIANPKYAKYHDTTQASALLVALDFKPTRKDIAYIRVADPYAAFLRTLRAFTPALERPEPGIHPAAVIGGNVTLGEEISVGPNVVIGSGCSIGNGAILYPNVVLGNDVTVGENCCIHANVSVYRGARIGSNVMIHSGTVIGADGFGFVPNGEAGWEKIPQVGIVVIEDNVEIGANCTIDRATLGETRISRGVKLDNLIHIAHNVTVGENTVIAAQTGVSGSTRIGVGNLIAGQVGIVGHIETADGVIIEAQSGVSKSIRKPGRYFGHPVKEHSLALRQEGALRQLPDLLAEIRDMRNRIAQLEAALGVAE
jgi:UDP-3-O-[3-hydroxymyristoyl] glucosamine N-acyltransferase